MEKKEVVTSSTQTQNVNWVKACSTSSIPENEGGCVMIDNKQIAVFNSSATGEWFATDNMCPHKMQMILSRGMIGDHCGEPKVACPYHKKTFSLKTGECLSGEEYLIQTYPVKIEDNHVFIGLSKH
jgi:nitrite reductase (NADH) small subunit